MKPSLSMSLVAAAILLCAGCADHRKDEYLAAAKGLSRDQDTYKVVLMIGCTDFAELWNQAVEKKWGDESRKKAMEVRETGERWKNYREYRPMAEKARGGLFAKLGLPPEGFAGLHERLVRREGIISDLQELYERPAFEWGAYVDRISALDKEYRRLTAEVETYLPSAK